LMSVGNPLQSLARQGGCLPQRWSRAWRPLTKLTEIVGFSRLPASSSLALQRQHGVTVPGTGGRSLAFPARLLQCQRDHAALLKYNPHRCAPGHDRSRGLPNLRLFLRDAFHPARPRSVPEFQSRKKLLSWGFPKIPSTGISVARPLLDGCPSFGERAPPLPLVPPLPFLPATTVSSARPLAGLLHPATSPGVRTVSDRLFT